MYDFGQSIPSPQSKRAPNKNITANLSVFFTKQLTFHGSKYIALDNQHDLSVGGITVMKNAASHFIRVYHHSLIRVYHHSLLVNQAFSKACVPNRAHRPSLFSPLSTSVYIGTHRAVVFI